MNTVRVPKDSFDRWLQKAFINVDKASERVEQEIQAAGGEEAWRKLKANEKIETPEPDPIRDIVSVSAAL